MNFNPNDKLSQLLYTILVLNYITKYVNMFFLKYIFKNKYHIFIMTYLGITYEVLNILFINYYYCYM